MGVYFRLQVGNPSQLQLRRHQHLLGLARSFATKNAYALISPPAPRQAHAVLLEDAKHLLVSLQAQDDA